MNEYGYSLEAAMNVSLPAALVILDARSERINPGSAPSFIDRLAMKAITATERELRSRYRIIKD